MGTNRYLILFASFILLIAIILLIWLMGPMGVEQPDSRVPVEGKPNYGEIIIDTIAGDHVAEQVILDLSRYNENDVIEKEWKLNEAGFKKIKECLCGKLSLWDASAVPGVDLEDKVLTAKDKAEVQGDQVGFNLRLTTGPLTRDIQISDNTENPRPDDPQKPIADTNRALVAIIDTGIDTSHNYLRPYLWKNPDPGNAGDDCLSGDRFGYDFQLESAALTDPDGHGTHLAGILALSWPDTLQLDIMALKFHDGNQGFVFDATCALYYALRKGADIVNLSWGYKAQKESPLLTSALDSAMAAKTLVITSAGNDNDDNDQADHWPSNFSMAYNNTLAIAALDQPLGGLATFSNFGSLSVSFAAPGDDIESTFPGNQFAYLQGTSMAAAKVARAAAILKARYPGRSYDWIIDCLRNNLDPAIDLTGLVRDRSGLTNINKLTCGPPTM